MRKKLGLALGSGAVRGLAHIGVIQALVKNDIPIDYIAGTSIGAWVGAHYALYQDLARLEEFTVGKRKEKLMSFLEPSLAGGLIKGEKLGILLEEWLGHATFEDLKIPLRIVAADLISGEQVVFDRGSLALATRASMAVPGVFRPVPFEGKLLIDGGICNPVPDSIARAMGADVVLAVNLDNLASAKIFPGKKIGMSNVALRTLEVARHHLARYSLRNSDFILTPAVAHYASISDYFARGAGEEIVEAGEAETEKIIPELRRTLA